MKNKYLLGPLIFLLCFFGTLVTGKFIVASAQDCRADRPILCNQVD